MNSPSPSNWTRTTGPRPRQKAVAAEAAERAEHRALRAPRTQVGLPPRAPLLSTVSHLSHPAAKRTPRHSLPCTHTPDTDSLHSPGLCRLHRGPCVSPQMAAGRAGCRNRSGLESASETTSFCPLERENCLQSTCV